MRGFACACPHTPGCLLLKRGIDKGVTMWGVSDSPPEYVYPLLASSVAEVKNPLTLEAKDPKKATAALEMLAAGESYEEVGHKLGVSYSQLVSLKNRHGGKMDVKRERQ